MTTFQSGKKKMASLVRAHDANNLVTIGQGRWPPRLQELASQYMFDGYLKSYP